jgi:fructosamine-3-kinase
MAHPHPSQLGAWLAQQLAEPGPLALAGVEVVGGGCIHRAWRLELADGRRFFLKGNRQAALPLLEAEADGLQALAACGAPPLVVPKPLAVGAADGWALLLLPWLNLAPSGSRGQSSAGQWQAVGGALADLHRTSGQGQLPGAREGSYGWPCDNFIGSTPQRNSWHNSWADFFVACRLAPQLQLLAQGGQPLRRSEDALEQARRLLASHQPQPALVHGDLWSGNGGLLEEGGGTIFDPAVYLGDREVDLAMARLFGGFPEAFFRGYRDRWPLDPGSEQRVELYNLYHLLNHANLFGGSYVKQAQASLDWLVESR